MDIAEEAARWQAKRKGRPWAFVVGGMVSPRPFEGFELVALPDGRLLDAIPLDAVPVVGISRGSFQLLEAFA